MDLLLLLRPLVRRRCDTFAPNTHLVFAKHVCILCTSLCCIFLFKGGRSNQHRNFQESLEAVRLYLMTTISDYFDANAYWSDAAVYVEL